MDIRISIKMLSILLVLAGPPTLVHARRCYVCGEGADSPFRTAPKATSSSSHHPKPAVAGSLPSIVTTCEDFERDRDEPEKYVLECPPTFTSCLTEVDGDIELRTCGENLPINDCKSANNIDYCYCSEDLCNSLKRTQIRREIEASQLGAQSEHLKQHEPHNSDDEDLSESSGMEDSNEKHHHRTSLLGPGMHNNININNNNNHHLQHQTEKDLTTTQVIMTLKPIPTTERRNSSQVSNDSATSSVASSGSRTRWSLQHSRSNVLSLVVAAAATIWRFTCRAEFV